MAERVKCFEHLTRLIFSELLQQLLAGFGACLLEKICTRLPFSLWLRFFGKKLGWVPKSEPKLAVRDAEASEGALVEA